MEQNTYIQEDEITLTELIMIKLPFPAHFIYKSVTQSMVEGS